MKKIVDNDFFKFIEKDRFNEAGYLKLLYSKKESGHLRHIKNGLILKEAFFIDQKDLIRSLIYSIKYKSLSDIKEKANLRKSFGSSRYSTKDSINLLKKYPFLENELFLNKLLDKVSEQCSIWSDHCRGSCSFKDRDFFIRFLLSIKEEDEDNLSIYPNFWNFYVNFNGNNFLIKDDLIQEFLSKKILRISFSAFGRSVKKRHVKEIGLGSDYLVNLRLLLKNDFIDQIKNEP